MDDYRVFVGTIIVQPENLFENCYKFESDADYKDGRKPLKNARHTPYDEN